MLAKICSYSISSLDAYPIIIEVHITQGLPGIYMVGLPDNAVRESKERVRSAIKNSGYKFPDGRITINLSPADVKKEGPAFDLSIALGILAASDQINVSWLDNYVFLGELSLDGHIQPIKGALAITLSLPRDKCAGIILPIQNATEAAIPGKVPVYPRKTLAEVVCFLQNPETVEPFTVERESLWQKANKYDVDFAEVKGQAHVKRGLEVAAAGGHNVLLLGPPGSGKTMLAKRMLSILPDMTMEEALETTKIYSVMGLTAANKNGLVNIRPFRCPHHTSSDVALVGGGSVPKPGEVTLAHNGILFLDELPEFSRNGLESLRQPLEDHHVTISRASQTVRFPSRFMLICTMNPCPCGWYTDPAKECHCTSMQIQKYMSKISGPLLDRIDIHLEVPSLRATELLSSHIKGEASAEIKKRTTQSRLRQQQRFEEKDTFRSHSRVPILDANRRANEMTRPQDKNARRCSIATSRTFLSENAVSSLRSSSQLNRNLGMASNSQMNHYAVKKHCALTENGKKLLKAAIEELGLSARAYDKVLKVARTIADLSGQENILSEHLSEAIQYRALDRNW